ncbi:hypothetical protein B0T21DRAFT_359621 [Apiosordaria backusii]|uniref:Axial budding pattern protein 2 n=1 Tax=Apiosordaria backusii TaxID=314023 RepID=A0AA40ETU1_9PEZI|nr:hypothetical protein B0T21DRAFT_359621 [Apiosordaria backusii]
MTDNTPLPAWISFDSNKLSFSGRTPPLDSLIQPPQRFAFHLLASDVAGFAGAALEFDIVVGVHQISADETTAILAATPGKRVSYTNLKEMVKLDGRPTGPGEVTLSTSSDMPTWLSVNKDNWDITGTPTEKASSTNFTITFQDGFSDTLNITVLVDVENEATKAAGVFKGSLPILTATPGQHFSFDFRPHLVNPSDTDISVSQGDPASWIRFDANKKIISGDPPPVSKDTVAAVEVQAKSKSTNKSDKLSLKVLVRAASHSTPTSETPSDADSTLTGGVLPVGGDAAPSGKVNVVLLAVLLPVTILFAFIMAFALFWCYRRQRAKQRPRLTTRDISGPLPGSFVITSNGHSAPPSLPDISRNFDRSFSVGDVFTPEKKMYVESRSSFLTKGSAPPSMATVKLLPPSVRSKHGGTRGGGRMPFLGGGSFGAMRLGSSLASISERSANDEAGEMDERTAGLFGNKTTGSFRDGIEINIPSVQGTPRSRYTGTPDSRYDPRAMASPRPPSSSAGSDPETFPLRAESRLAHYGPPEIGRRFMWPWFRGNNSRSRSSKLRWGSRTHSKQPSTSTVDTFAYKRTGQSIGLGYTNAGVAPEMTPPPRARLVGAVPLARPVTRRGPTDASLEGLIFSRGQSEMSIPMNAPPTTPGGPSAPSSASQEDISLPALPNWRDTPDDFLGLSYEDLVKNSPFHPSATWQTISTTDEWVDETVQSMDTPQREVAKKETGTPSNWAVLQDSPVIKDWDAGIDSPSPVSIGPGDASTPGRILSPGGNEKREQPAAADVPTSSGTQPGLVLAAAPSLNVEALGNGGRSFQRDQSGLPKRSGSKGVSLMSGKSRGEESDFAVYI